MATEGSNQPNANAPEAIPGERRTQILMLCQKLGMRQDQLLILDTVLSQLHKPEWLNDINGQQRPSGKVEDVQDAVRNSL